MDILRYFGDRRYKEIEHHRRLLIRQCLIVGISLSGAVTLWVLTHSYLWAFGAAVEFWLIGLAVDGIYHLAVLPLCRRAYQKRLVREWKAASLRWCETMHARWQRNYVYDKARLDKDLALSGIAWRKR